MHQNLNREYKVRNFQILKEHKVREIKASMVTLPQRKKCILIEARNFSYSKNTLVENLLNRMQAENTKEGCLRGTQTKKSGTQHEKKLQETQLMSTGV